MENEIKLLPVGSVVYLKGGTQKLIVLARGQLIKTDVNDKQIFYDYMSGRFPLGFDEKEIYYFDKENIEKVVFIGYEDEEEARYGELLFSWKVTHPELVGVEKK